jgi:hypothetical protein
MTCDRINLTKNGQCTEKVQGKIELEDGQKRRTRVVLMVRKHGTDGWKSQTSMLAGCRHLHENLIPWAELEVGQRTAAIVRGKQCPVVVVGAEGGTGRQLSGGFREVDECSGNQSIASRDCEFSS